MDYKDFNSESGEKRRLRPRRKVGESRSFGERRSFDGEKRPSDGERRPFNGERRSFNGERRSWSGERKPYGERRSFGDKPSFGGERNFNDGERRPFNGERRSFNGGGRKPFGERRSFGDKPSFGGERSFGNGEGRQFDGEGRSFNGERRPFNGGNRKPYGTGDGSRRPYGERRSFGDKPSFGGERSFGNGEGRQFDGERRSFNGERRQFNGERRPFNGGNRKPYGAGSDGRKPFGAGKRGFGAKKSISRKQYEDYNHFRNEEESGISRMIDNRQLADTPAVMQEMAPAVMRGEVRLNKFIANSGICSRREADNFILAGVVTVNGVPVTELGSKINADVDDIRFNGERIHGEEKVYIVMNKPKGFVTTTTDPHAEKTVMDLLKGCGKRVFPVGRLDKNTTGVLMFTNDGEMAERLTHPSYDKKKIYQVSLDHALTEEDRDRILAGVTLSDGDVCADALEFIEDDDHRKIGIEIHSGKNRIVRRIFESLGYEVKALDRVYFAGLTKKSLKKGEWRFLTDSEVNILRMGSYQ